MKIVIYLEVAGCLGVGVERIFEKALILVFIVLHIVLVWNLWPIVSLIMDMPPFLSIAFMSLLLFLLWFFAFFGLAMWRDNRKRRRAL